MATTVLATSQSSAPEHNNNPRLYTPSPWGDFFLTHQPCTPEELISMKEKAKVKEEEVRHILLATAASPDLVRKLDLVDALQRLGVDYHYKKELDELLRAVHDDEHGGSDDLYVTSLRFYLLRKHGYNVSSDVFLKFRDEQGNITSDNVNCLMVLYDAAHMRTQGEEILDNTITFNRRRLQSVLMETDLEPELSEEVRFTLETTRFRRAKRVEARRYISVNEKKATRNEAVLEFAKLDYNILQALYCEELKELTVVWWKDFQLGTDQRYTRDRMVELHFWMMGVVSEPCYSYSRIMLTKFTVYATMFDDLYDNHGTTKGSNIFTTAMERWDVQIAEQLPAQLKALFINILNDTNKMVEELKFQENKHAELFKELVIHTAKSYHAEVKWRDEHYVPTNVEEHLQISMSSSVCMQITNLALISLGDVTTREDVNWAFTFPKIIRGACVVGRIGNDIVSHEREQASKHVVSTVQACMNQYGVTMEEANKKLRVTIEEAWMDIIEECLERKRPTTLLEIVVDLARTMDFIYKREDAFTLSFTLKDVIASMYVKSV